MESRRSASRTRQRGAIRRSARCRPRRTARWRSWSTVDGRRRSIGDLDQGRVDQVMIQSVEKAGRRGRTDDGEGDDEPPWRVRGGPRRHRRSFGRTRSPTTPSLRRTWPSAALLGVSGDAPCCRAKARVRRRRRERTVLIVPLGLRGAIMLICFISLLKTRADCHAIRERGKRDPRRSAGEAADQGSELHQGRCTWIPELVGTFRVVGAKGATHSTRPEEVPEDADRHRLRASGGASASREPPPRAGRRESPQHQQWGYAERLAGRTGQAQGVWESATGQQVRGTRSRRCRSCWG